MDNKGIILRKLRSQFSLLAAEIPEEIPYEGKIIRLREKVDKLIDYSEKGEYERALPEIVALEAILDDLITQFTKDVEDSKITPKEAESKLDQYLGMKRGLTILKAISNESLQPYSREQEEKQDVDQKERWARLRKKLLDE